MLALEDLLITHDEGFRLRADWSLPEGARAALIGPSGAGKSTLLAAISGFFPPVAGRVLWKGQDLGPLPPGERPLSMLFQDQNLFPHLTLAQNLGLGIRADLRLDRQDRARIEAVLDRVGLAGLAERRPAALSGGQASRAALARVLLRARPLLLLDEPFAALGPALRRDMLALVAELCAETGATLLMVTHDPGDAAGFCDLTVVVAEGRAEAPQPTGPLLADPPPVLADYLGRK